LERGQIRAGPYRVSVRTRRRKGTKEKTRGDESRIFEGQGSLGLWWCFGFVGVGGGVGGVCWGGGGKKTRSAKDVGADTIRKGKKRGRKPKVGPVKMRGGKSGNPSPRKGSAKHRAGKRGRSFHINAPRKSDPPAFDKGRSWQREGALEEKKEWPRIKKKLAGS